MKFRNCDCPRLNSPVLSPGATQLVILSSAFWGLAAGLEKEGKGRTIVLVVENPFVAKCGFLVNDGWKQLTSLRERASIK